MNAPDGMVAPQNTPAPVMRRQLPELGEEPFLLRIIGASSEVDDAKRLVVAGQSRHPRLERQRVFARLGSEGLVGIMSIVGDGSDGFSVQALVWMCDIDLERKGYTITHPDPLCVSETLAMAFAHLEANGLDVLAEIKRRRSEAPAPQSPAPR